MASKWWYQTRFRCPTCKKTWEEYDVTGGNYDSGTAPHTVAQKCEECMKRSWEILSESGMDGQT